MHFRLHPRPSRAPRPAAHLSPDSAARARTVILPRPCLDMADEVNVSDEDLFPDLLASTCRSRKRMRQKRGAVWLPQGQEELAARLPPSVRLDVVPGDGKCLFHCFQRALPDTDVASLMAAAGCSQEAWGDEEHLTLLADAGQLQVVVWPVDLDNFAAGIQREKMRRFGPGSSCRRLDLVHWSRCSAGLHFDRLVLELPPSIPRAGSPAAAAATSAEEGRDEHAPVPAVQLSQAPDDGRGNLSGRGQQPPALGQDRVEQDVEELLRLFLANESCEDFLRSLPEYVSEDGAPKTLPEMDAWLESAIQGMAGEAINSKARLEMLPYLADTTLYPLIVLCEAAAQANGIPFEFLLDSFVAVAHSLLNKHFCVHLGQYESKSRYWVVGTAEPGVGKSPAIEPIMQILFGVLRDHAALLHGSPSDDFHFMQSSTTAAAIDKLRSCDGYLCLYTGEAGRCLDLGFAAGGKSDASKVVDLTFFLDAAHGAEFSHQTLWDRQRKMKEKVPNPNSPVPMSERLCIQATNMHILWLQQELYLAKYWCLLGKQKPIGLLQRCLFAFGSQKHRYNPQLIRFFDRVFAPVVKKVFTYILQNLGPKADKAVGHSLELSPEQTRLVSRVQQTLALCGQRKAMPATLRDAMPKALFWLGTGLITNQVLGNAFEAVWRDRPEFDRHVSDDAFCSAVHFIARRYLSGMAVVTTCIGEQLWIGMDLLTKSEVEDPQRLLLTVLRKSAGSTITISSICNADLGIRRDAASESASTRARAQEACRVALQRLRDLGFGVYIPESDGETAKLIKFSRETKTPAARSWLHEHRVSLQFFPLRGVDARGSAAAQEPRPDGTFVPDGRTESAAEADVVPAVQPKRSGESQAKTAENSGLAGEGSLDPSRKRARRRVATEIETSSVLETPLLSRALFHEKCAEWFRIRNIRSVCVKTAYDEEKWERVARCRESHDCAVQWRLSYFLRPLQVPANTFLVVRYDTHTHSGEPRTGRVWSPQGLQAAREYLRDHETPTLRGLTAYIARQVPSEDVSRRGAISNWLRQSRQRQKREEAPVPEHVDTSLRCIEEWARSCKASNAATLYVLSPYILSGSEVCILFSSAGMLEGTIARYAFDRVHLAVDGKYKVSNRGWTIFSVSFLCKDFPRNTSLFHAKAGPSPRVPGRATTTRAFPVLQAILQAETAENIVRVFRALCKAWSEQRADDAVLPSVVKQVHKDYLDSIEKTRQEVFPLSRPVNDYFHLAEKEKTISAKCCKLVLHKAKYVKENYDWVVYTLSNIRFAPRPDLFSHLWQGMLTRLVALGESEVARYLHKEFCVLLPGADMKLPNIPSELALGKDAKYFFAPHWTGLWGVFPGTASGNQPAEALHSPWQQLLAAEKAVPNVCTIFPIMQKVYEQWRATYSWDSASALSPMPSGVDPGLVNGRVLARVGRSPALDYHTAIAGGRRLVHVRELQDRAWMAIARSTEKDLVEGDAEVGLNILDTTSANMGTLLFQRGILTILDDEREEVKGTLGNFEWPHHAPGGRPILFHNEPFNRVFGDVKYVYVTAKETFCTCAAFMLYMQCEHVVYAESRSFSCRQGTRDFAALPAQQKRGRPKGSGSIVRGKK